MTIQAALSELEHQNAVDRLHVRDARLWSDELDAQEVVANRLGWLDVVPATGEFLQRLTAVRDALPNFDRVVLAGMGGSSLAPEVFAKIFAGVATDAALDLLDSTHPAAVAAVLDDVDLSATVCIVASKSGSTEETACFASHAADLLPPERLIAITDAGSKLEQQATEAGWAAVVINPADIGGRYSALSFFGGVPAALLGVPVEEAWAAAANLLEQCKRPAADNPAAQLAAFLAGNAQAGRDKMTLVAPTALAPLGDWIEQLVAESTGKQGRGIVPIVGEPLADPAVYGEDRCFVVLRHGADAVLGVDELVDAGHPVFSIDVADRGQLGAEFVRWEVATALVGVLLGVNPFDEPNVSESKANTVAVLEEVTDGAQLPPAEDGDVAALLAQLRAGDYLSIQAYLPPTEANAEALQRLRSFVRDRLGVATTVGWGPRFLHSTGQLHKGGADNVVALQIVDAPVGGPGIPDRPYDFATLVRAQALGDLRSLRDHERRVAQVGVGDGGIEQVVSAVEAATR